MEKQAEKLKSNLTSTDKFFKKLKKKPFHSVYHYVPSKILF